MSREGRPSTGISGRILQAPIAIVAAQWHEEIMRGLIDGAVRCADRLGVEYSLFEVPGSFELPVACRTAADADYAAVVALGVVVRGGTPHFEYVCSGVTTGLTQVAVQSAVPVTFGVLTTDTVAQARDRAGFPDSAEDKGGEAVQAAVSTALTLRDIGGRRRQYPGFTPA